MCLDLPAPQFSSVIIADRKARWCEASQPTAGLRLITQGCDEHHYPSYFFLPKIAV
jgi:Ribbon-helix-helix protein, copG family